MVEAIGEDFPGNSYNKRSSTPGPDRDSEKSSDIPEKVQMQKIVSGVVIRRRKNPFVRFWEMLTGDDSSSVGSYIVEEVVMPAIRATIVDSISTGAERIFGGRGASQSTSYNRYGSQVYTPYNKMSEPQPNRRAISQRGRSTHQFDEIILDSRGEAEEVLDRLCANIEKFGMTSVSDLYDLVGISKDYVDDRWGWTNLRDARPRRVAAGVLLELPPTEPID